MAGARGPRRARPRTHDGRRAHADHAPNVGAGRDPGWPGPSTSRRQLQEELRAVLKKKILKLGELFKQRDHQMTSKSRPAAAAECAGAGGDGETDDDSYEEEDDENEKTATKTKEAQ